MTAAAALGRLLEQRERALAALLVSGAGLLAVEIRFEHREVLGETWHAWIPLVYALGLALLGGASVLAWERGGRRVLLGLFALGLLVGPVGLLFHTGGHPVSGIGKVLSAWALPVGKGGEFEKVPPALAPLAFAGLAAMGVVVCLKRPGAAG